LAACRSTEEGQQVALEIGDAFDFMICQFFQAWALLRLGQWDKLLPLLASAIQMAEKNGHQSWAMLFQLELAWGYQQMFCFELALKLCQEGFQKAQELQLGYGQLLSSVLLGFSHLGLHKADSAIECFEIIRARLDHEQLLMDWIWEIPLHLGLSRCWLLRNDLCRARWEAEQAFQIAVLPGERIWMAGAQNLLIEISLAESNNLQAQQDLSRALEILEGTDLPLAAWRVYISAAKLFEHQDQMPEATEYWTRSASVLKRMAGRLSEYPDLRDTFLASPHLPGKLRQMLGSGATRTSPKEAHANHRVLPPT
jgi:tetratricopeptide (TPR) repeat protein